MAKYGLRQQLTVSIKAEIVQRYQQGEGLNDLAVAYHHSRNITRRVLEEAGVTVRRRGMTNPHAATPIELRLHDALRAAGIGFQTQRRLVGRYVVDILINQQPVIIEADGFQHTLERQVKHDAIRDNAHVDNGYRVFRFSGSDINKDAAACVRYVVQECNLVPDAEPSYDVRTSFRGYDHPRWEGGPQEYICDVCEAKFIRQPAHRSGKGTFCSLICYHQSLTGRKLSAEHKDKISKAVKGRERRSPPPPFTEEHRVNLSNALKGKKKSPEHVAKVVEANRRARQAKIESELRGDT